MQGIFDSHAHYNDGSFDQDREEVFLHLQNNGVCGVINVGCDAESSYRSIALARKYPFVYAAVGIHPEMAGEVIPELDSDNLSWLGEIELLLDAEKVVAVGEIGLDYHYGVEYRAAQKILFAQQLSLAKRAGFPVIIHSRDATADTLALLREHRPTGVLHCFGGSVETAEEVLSLGMYVGLTGLVTFPNAKKVKEVAAMLPLDRLLLETDCPYMAPVPYRGKRTTSDMIAQTASVIAEIRGISPQEVVDAARENTMRLFSIPAQT